jgi:hypothetical protein
MKDSASALLEQQSQSRPGDHECQFLGRSAWGRADQDPLASTHGEQADRRPSELSLVKTWSKFRLLNWLLYARQLHGN